MNSSDLLLNPAYQWYPGNIYHQAATYVDAGSLDWTSIVVLGVVAITYAAIMTLLVRIVLGK